MEMEQFHMNGGDEDISYANNSLLQRTVISMVKPILENSISDVYCKLSPECLRVADLGSSTGPNTIKVVSEIVDIIANTSKMLNQPAPSLQVFLNDLYENDFNALSMSLPKFYQKLKLEKENNFVPCFVSIMPGSFYERLFPNNSLHFVHSSYSIMWLSKVPKGLMSKTREAFNKGNICIAKTSPLAVFKAYYKQFESDFTLFLKYRAQELVHGGGMVLTTMGSINSNNPLSIWEVVGLKLNDMVLEGLIAKDKLDFFNLPYYAATEEEVRRLIEEEGSFTLQKLETMKMDWDTSIVKANINLDKHSRAKIVSNTIRAVGEPILARQFGKSMMDDLFRRFEDVVLDHMVENKCEYISLVMCLTKKT